MRSDLSKRRNIWSTNNFAFLKDDNDGDSSWEDDGDDAGDASNISDQQTT